MIFSLPVFPYFYKFRLVAIPLPVCRLRRAVNLNIPFPVFDVFLTFGHFCLHIVTFADPPKVHITLMTSTVSRHPSVNLNANIYWIAASRLYMCVCHYFVKVTRRRSYQVFEGCLCAHEASVQTRDRVCPPRWCHLLLCPPLPPNVSQLVSSSRHTYLGSLLFYPQIELCNASLSTTYCGYT